MGNRFSCFAACNDSIDKYGTLNDIKTRYMTYGYIRRHTKYSIPSDITEIVLNYTNNTINWTLDTNDFAEIFNLNPGDIYNGPKYRFRLNNIDIFLQFQISKQTNGNGINLFLVPMDEHDQYIQKATIYTLLCCKELEKYHKCCVEGRVEWRLKSPDNLNEYGYNSIKFECDVDLLGVNDYYKQISLNQNTKTVWNIKNELLNQFKHAPVGWYFYSNEFDPINKNWGLRCMPCNKYGNTVIQLRFIRFPQNIHSIKAQIKLYLNGEIKWGLKTINIENIFDRNYKWFAWNGKKELMLTSQLYEMKQFKIKIKIKIVTVYTYDSSMNPVAVPPCHWHEYNVNL